MEGTGSLIGHIALKNMSGEHPRLHAKNLDKKLGFKIPKIEVKLLQKFRAYDQQNDVSSRKQHFEGSQVWIGLHPQALQTPYCDIYEALSILKFDIDHIVDIGAGYGRVGIVSSVLYPGAKFTGYEIVKQRQAEGNRIFKKWGISNAFIKLENVLQDGFEIPEANIYFIYDFSQEEDINKVLRKLSLKAQKNFFLITKGDRVDYLMKNKLTNTWKMFMNFESSHLKIYTPKMLVKEKV